MKLILALIGAFLFLGGLGIEKNLVQIGGLAFGGLLLLVHLFFKKKISLPHGFLAYGLFLLFLFAYHVLSPGRSNFDYLVLFTSGGLFWLFFYNQRSFIPKFSYLILALGVLFGLGYFLHPFLGVEMFNRGLIAPYTKTHHHLGDFWVVPLLITLALWLKKKRWWHYLFFALGIFFLTASLSRSAYVALAIGVTYLFIKKGLPGRFRRVFWTIIGLSALLFLSAGIFKTTLYSRAYFVQGAVGFVRNPLGVGMGNFDLISRDPAANPWGMKFFSSLAHNVFLEVLVGMGVLGLTFIYWFIKVARNLWKAKDKETLVYQAIFFALTANFFFDTTYVIPTMVWLWFMALGVSQNQEKGA